MSKSSTYSRSRDFVYPNLLTRTSTEENPVDELGQLHTFCSSYKINYLCRLSNFKTFTNNKFYSQKQCRLVELCCTILFHFRVWSSPSAKDYAIQSKGYIHMVYKQDIKPFLSARQEIFHHIFQFKYCEPSPVSSFQ